MGESSKRWTTVRERRYHESIYTYNPILFAFENQSMDHRGNVGSHHTRISSQWDYATFRWTRGTYVLAQWSNVCWIPCILPFDSSYVGMVSIRIQDTAQPLHKFLWACLSHSAVSVQKRGHLCLV